MDAHALASFRTNTGTRKRQIKTPGNKWGHVLPANLTHSKVAREKKPQQPKPVGTKPPPKPAVNPVPAKLGRSFSSYRVLIETCRARAEELDLSRAELDRLSGLPAGYSGKLLGNVENSEKPKNQKRVWRVGLEAMLGALGLKIVVIEDEAAAARTLALRVPVDRSQQRFGNVSRIGNALAIQAPPEDRQALDSCAEEEANAA